MSSSPPPGGGGGNVLTDLPEALLVVLLCAVGAPTSPHFAELCPAAAAALWRALGLVAAELGRSREDLTPRISGRGGPARAVHLLERRRAAAAEYLGCISADFHVLARGPRGSILAFGKNDGGQLGVGDRRERLAPARVAASGQLRAGAACVSAGGEHSAFVDAAGGAWVCGISDASRLKEGMLVPYRFAGLQGVRVCSVACGWDFTLFLTAVGEVFCNVESNSRDASVEFYQMESLEFVVQISAGNGHAMALADNGVPYVWGLNEFCQAPLEDIPRACEILRPSPPLGRANIVSISAGGFHSMALTDDGSLFTWGQGRSGQLGHGGIGALGDEVHPRWVAGLRRVQRISAGDLTSLVLAADGTVFGMGRNFEGQLGQGVTARRVATPTCIPCTPASGAHVVDVCAGKAASYFVLSNGSVLACGCGYNGRLGVGSHENAYSTVEVPGLVVAAR